MRASIDAIAATARTLLSTDLLAVAGFLVAPDVWDALVAHVPVARGGSFSVGDQLYVRLSNVLPSGAIVPVDAKCIPIDKPTPRHVERELRQAWCSRSDCNAGAKVGSDCPLSFMTCIACGAPLTFENPHNAAERVGTKPASTLTDGE